MSLKIQTMHLCMTFMQTKGYYYLKVDYVDPHTMPICGETVVSTMHLHVLVH